MPPSGEPTRQRPALLRLQDVRVPLPGGGELGPITWTLQRGRRIRVRCADEAQWTAFVGLLTGQLRPAAGTLEEVRQVRVQTDTRLRETLDLNRTLQDYLKAPDTPEAVWLEGRRRSLWVLLDLLGIAPAHTRRVLKLESEAVRHRAWVLRFLLSQADLVIGRAVFQSDDPQVQAALHRRWGDIPGALVAGEGARPLPGRAEGWVAFDAHGGCTTGPEPDPPASP